MTKNKSTETGDQDLSSRLEHLNDFLENAPMALHWVNGSGIIIWVNQAEVEMLGYTRDELINKHISNFHLDKEVIDDIIKRLINKETLIDYPARLLCKNGDIKYVLINSNVYWKNGEFTHTRCFTKDITNIVKEKNTAAIRIQELEAKVEKLKKNSDV